MANNEMVLFKLGRYNDARMKDIDEELRTICDGKESREIPQAPTGFHKAMENIANADERTLDKFGLQMYILDHAVRARRRQLCPDELGNEYKFEREDQKTYRNAIMKGFLSDLHTYWGTLMVDGGNISFLYALMFPGKVKEDTPAKTFIVGMRGLFHGDILGDVMDVIVGIQEEKCRLVYRGALIPYDGIVCQTMGYFLQHASFMRRTNEVYSAMCKIIKYFSRHAIRS